MRKMQYKQPYLYETIRPEKVICICWIFLSTKINAINQFIYYSKKVYEACKYLITTPVYQEEGIVLSDESKNINMPMYFQETDTLIPVRENEDSQEMQFDSAEEPNSSESPYETEVASGDIR